MWGQSLQGHEYLEVCTWNIRITGLKEKVYEETKILLRGQQRIIQPHPQGHMQALRSSMQDLVPQPGTEPGPLHWECGVSTTGPPGEVLCFPLFLSRNSLSKKGKFGLHIPKGKVEGRKKKP